MIPPPPFPELLVHNFSPRVVPPDGSGSSQIMLVGEASGRHETDALIPFHPKADAGSVLARVMRRAGVSRDSFTLTNTCWMRPPNNELEGCSYEQLAIDLFCPYNDALIAERAPKVIITYGNVALKSFTPYGRTDSTSISHLQGYILPGPHSSLLLPQLHPSFILHGQARFTEALIWGMLRAHELVRDGLRPQPTRYVTTPTLDDLLQFERGYNPDRHFLAHDIETPDSSKLTEEEVEDTVEDISYNILRISLCYDSENGYAISMPWQEPFITVVKRMLASYGPKETWNGSFDTPRLKAAGAITNGRMYDRMRSWRFLHPTLPASLEFVTPLLGWSLPPWKFQNQSDPEFYSAVDSLALRFDGAAIESTLRAKGLYERHERHVVEVIEVLNKMSDNGLPYDQEEAARFEVKLETMKKERESDLQSRVPDALKVGKQKNGYKKVPKFIAEVIAQSEGRVIEAVKRMEIAEDEETNEKVEVEVKYELRSFTLPLDDLTKEEKGRLGDFLQADPSNPVVIRRWVRLKPFLPTSWQQLLKLIKFYGQKPGTNYKTKKETTDDETLRKLIRKCLESKRPKDKEFAALLKVCRECRQLSKVIGTYIKGWRPKADGRIHATPGIWGKMYRVSWRNPNIAGTVADKQEDYVAAGFRKCVKAPPGKVLVEGDWKSMEAKLVGHFAGDPDYMRLSALGVHDYFCTHVLVMRGKMPASDIPSLSLSDDTLARIFKNVKKAFPKDRDDAKHCCHGIAYGLGPNLMSMRYEMPLSEAEKLIEFYFHTFPKIKAWQDAVRARAHRDAKLVNVYGYCMSFYEIFKWNSQRYERLAAIWRKPESYQANGLRYSLTRNESEWHSRVKELVDGGLKLDDAISKLCWDDGKDADSAVAFLPRDTGAGMLKEALLKLRPLVDERVGIGCAHDSILCEVSGLDAEIERVATLLKSTMESPVPELNGLVIGAEIAVGPTWEKDAMEVWEPTTKEALA